MYTTVGIVCMYVYVRIWYGICIEIWREQGSYSDFLVVMAYKEAKNENSRYVCADSDIYIHTYIISV